MAVGSARKRRRKDCVGRERKGREGEWRTRGRGRKEKGVNHYVANLISESEGKSRSRVGNGVILYGLCLL